MRGSWFRKISQCVARRTRIYTFLAAVFTSSLALAQTPTAEITGLVTDTTGAVVPSVKIEVTNIETQARRESLTNASGFYNVNLLPPGMYKIEAQKAGFRPVIRGHVELAVAQSARIDFSVELGPTSQAITVTSSAPLLDSQSASLGQVVQERAVADLPLNGRNYLNLARLTPGVSDAGHGDPTAASGSFVANGVRAQLTNYNLDGTDNNSRIVDVQNQSYEVIQPSIDALREFKIETNNYSAEYGYSAGAVVNATLKSGTNQYHGDVFEFLRNDHLDARDYFLAPTAQKQRHQRNQYGGILGAPVVRNKTFLFASWERTAENLGLTLVSTLPSPAQRAGNFQSALPIYDPVTTTPSGNNFTRTQFPGNIIPASRIDPVAAKLTTLLPSATFSGASNNYVYNPIQTTQTHRIDSRGDQNFSASDTLFVRFSYLTQAFVNPGPLPAPLIGATSNNQNNHATQALSSALGQTHILSSSVVNEFTTGYSRIYDNRGDLLSGSALAPQYGFLGIPVYPNIVGLPNISLSGYAPLGEASNVPNGKLAEVLQFKENLSWIRGSHAFKFGAQYEWVRSYFALSGQARGAFTFTPSFTQDPLNRTRTGDSFADFLLGIPDTATLSNTTIGDVRQNYISAFAQDDWKVTPRLTVNIGVRYELWTPRVERHDLQGNFVPSQNKLIYPENKIPAGIPSGAVTTIPDGVGRRSLVRQYNLDFAPRLGIAYQLDSSTVIRAGAGIFYASPNFPGVGATPPGDPPFLITNSYVADQIHPIITFAGGFPANALDPRNVNLSTAGTPAFALDFKPENVAKWSFGVQRQIFQFVVEANYVGTKSTHLNTNFNLNQPYPGPGTTDSRRPYQGFATISFTTPLGNANYNALEFKVERRLTNGLQMQVAYTFSRNIDIGGEQLLGDTTLRDARNLAAERGLSTSDERHRFAASFIYELPLGTGKPLNIRNKYANAVIGNWQTNGIVTVHSGQPITPELSINTANTGDNRPNRIGDGNLPSDKRTVQHWFDTSAFQAAPPYVFGNAGRNIVIAPGAANVDFSIFKSFRFPLFGETGSVQTRAEFFNLFNHPQFGLPNATVNIAQGGSITSLSNAMRQIQFGLKVIF